MGKPIRILYIDDYPLDRELVRDALEQEGGGFQVVEATSRADFEAQFAQGNYDIVLSDFNILGFEGVQVIDTVHAKSPHIPVVIVSGTGSEEIAAEAMKRGAADYVIKTPNHIRRLPLTIHAALEKKRLQEEHAETEQALRDSEASLALAQQIAHIGSWKYTVKSETLHWSDELFRLYGLNPGEHTASLDIAIDAIHPDDKDFAQAAFRKALESGVPYEIEYRIIRPDGQERTILGLGRVEKDQDGHILSVFGTGQDITERIRMEQTLRESESRFRGIFNNAPDIVTFTDIKGTIREINHVMPGYNKQDVIGANVADFLSKDEEAKFHNAVARALETGEPTSYQTSIRSPEGVLTYWDNRLAPIKIDERADGLVINCTDVTERKRTEERVREGDERLRAIVAALPDPVFVLDEDGRYIEILAADQSLLAQEAAQVKGRLMHDVLPQTVADQSLAAVRSALDSDELSG